MPRQSAAQKAAGVAMDAAVIEEVKPLPPIQSEDKEVNLAEYVRDLVGLFFEAKMEESLEERIRDLELLTAPLAEDIVQQEFTPVSFPNAEDDADDGAPWYGTGPI